MRDAVVDSHRSWPPEGGTPRNAFAWGTNASEPSLFEVTILLQGVRYQYGFVLDHERILEEWVYAWPKGRKQTWLEREGDSYKFGEHLRGENRVIEQVIRPNALFLSVAVQHHHEQLAALHAWFRDVRTLGVNGYRERFGDVMPGATAAAMLAAMTAAAAVSTSFRLSDFLQPPNKRDESEGLGRLFGSSNESASFRRLLKSADVGIVDVKLLDNEEPGKRRRILVRHHSSSQEAWLPLEEESHGTRALFRLGPILLGALSSGGLLVVDELEASLHPLLALRVVRQFNDPRTNPDNGQLLFTTHDTNLLGGGTGDAPLRRDQVWLTEKDEDGATCVYPLTDYKPRKAENLERGYLQDRYGAIPYLGKLARLEE